ncbi:hypothetical protein WMF28_33645 [Sorangium sp. So ce590]|uniref:hypothetical protein n=1 Tax=Sorangium sp. So ce590 TaxID=3133317 RepID=UPI003F5FEA85
MVHFELDEREARDMRTALSIRLVGMREELVHTDNREYREYLKAAIERLEGVLRRLDAILAGLTSRP